MSNMKKNKPPTLRPDEEEELLKEVLSRAKQGLPVRRQDVIDKVVKFIQSDKRKNPFRNGTPGDKWFSLFRRRHNSHFMELDPSQLENVEKVGFTEKVMATVQYIKGPGGVLRRNDGPMVKRNPAGRPRLVPTPVHESPPHQSSSSPLSDDSPHDSTMETDDGDGKSQDSQSEPPDFQPGSRLEVMDFNEKWYPVKVVEVDYDEGEVLVHFEKWSDRYDEWVRMDSNRIRRPTLPQISATKKVFEKNERVIAVWAYNHKYPATVRDVLPNDKYEVLFCDGYAKILRGCKLFKATEEDLKNCQLPPPKKPAPPMGADPIDPDLGPKEERRLKKRRMDVLEAFRPHKRQKSDGNQLTPESSPQPSTSTFTPSLSLKSKETPKIVLKGRGRPPNKPREREEERQDEDYDEDSGGEGPATLDTPRPESEAKLRKPRRKKRLFDESTYIYRGPKQRPGMEEDHERWNVEIPEGASPVQIKDQEGYYRESVIIPDKKMLPGWTKHTMRRKSGAKWDVFLVNPKGRKFRSRNELRNYFAVELKQPFPEDSFDFMVGRKLEMIRTQGDGKRKLDSSGVDGEGQTQGEKKSGDSTPDYRRIRTLLPKGRLLEGEEGKSDQSPGSPATPTLTSPPFPLTELRTPDGGFTCCGKNFRKENLFQMHMKHYHPEYSTLFGSTPNVADLAYARTVGEPLEDSRAEAMAPRNTLLERVTRYEAERKASETATASASSGGKILPSKEPAPVAPPVTEEPVTTPLLEKTEDTPAAPSVVEEAVVDNPIAAEEKESSGNEIVEEVAASAEILAPQPPPVEEQVKPTVEVKEDSEIPAPEEASPAPPSTAPSPVTTTHSVPVIRPVSKQTALVPKTTASTEPASQVPPTSTQKSHPTPTVRTPITITKYVPPGQKPAVSSLTKLTISMTAQTSDKEVKPTIKTLLPMRPPPQEAKEAQEAPKLKEVTVKEESEEEAPVRIKPRKRTVSEPFPKKPKLVKHPTGSLEEEPALDEEVQPSHTVVNPSYRFSRNRSQVPRVSLEKLVITPDSNGESTVSSEPLPDNEAQDAVYENLRKEEIINCTCGYMEEDGLMIQCDLCLCWQHGLCNDIDKESDVPEKYVCHICLNPARERPSTRFLHNQDWLKEGKLPSLSICQKNKDGEVQRETMLKKSHDLVASLLELQTVIRSLRVKTHIATKPDHPKLYLWANSWKNENAEVRTGNEEDNCKQEVSGPQPEAAIDETECRLRLLEHVEDYQHQVDDRLTSIQAQIAALESEDPDLASDEASDHCPATKQTVQMILHDLCTVRRVATLN
ncbi:PHD finger protein 20-like protein 1 isoform X4 [Homalodisca vitripennis]|uniref:PHD finger protein 20-like protein 1 isoform X4 n=1 Tax=Homalodisca vitripennis TaxID=197043 RepID=UPI001EEA5961|nr:PHD finger protein 20-like protein 1 isoform X4 [Homalodisca vitripennis]